MKFSKYSCDILAFVSFLCAHAYFLRSVFSVPKIQMKILVQKHYDCLYRLLRRDAVQFNKTLSTFRRNIFHLSSQKKITKSHLRRLLYIYPQRNLIFNNFMSLLYRQQTESPLCQIRLPVRIYISLSKLTELFNRYLHQRNTVVSSNRPLSALF